MKTFSSRFRPASLLAGVAALALATAPTAMAGLVAHWTLDDGSGTTATESVSGYNGTLLNSPAWNGSGILGAHSLNFPTTSAAYISMGTVSALDITNAITLSAWWRNPGAPSGQYSGCVLSHGYTYFFGLGNSGTQLWFGFNSGGWRDFLGTTTMWTPDTWYHVAATMDTNKNIKLFVNGVLETNYTTTYSRPSQPTYAVEIARNNRTPAQLFKGDLDDLGIWNEALDPKKIALIHGLGRFSGVDLGSPSIDGVLAVFNAGTGSAVAGSQTWRYRTGLGSTTVGATGGSVAGGNAYIVLDSSGNGVSVSTNADTVPPALSSLSPADNATNVMTSVNLVATFSEAIQPGTGNLTLKRTSDNTTVETFDVTSSSRLAFSGNTLTVDPTSDLGTGVGFYVQIAPTAIEDLAGNSFAGITDTTSWSFTTASAAAGGFVIKLDLSTAGDGDGGSLADWNQLNNGGTIASGSVKLHGGGIAAGVTITVSAPATSGYNNDPNASGWGGMGTDPYYIPAADDLVYTVAGPLQVTFGGLSPSLTYNVRVYSLINENLAPINISVTDGAGLISRTGLVRSTLYNTVPLSADLIFSGVSADGSSNLVVSISSTAAVSAEAVVLEARDPALPTARFNASPTNVVAPVTIAFTDTSTPGAGTITNCHWAFGDGGSADSGPGATVTHTYSTPGIYQATLTVTTLAGQSDAASRSVNAVGAPAYVIDPNAPSATISPLLFGHNLEVTRRAVWSGLGAEMVANRKFAVVASAKPLHWYALTNGGGSIASDSTVAYAGTKSVRVNVNTAGQTCGLGQTNDATAASSKLTFSQGTNYTFRLWLKTLAPRSVWLRLTDTETGATICQVQTNLDLTATNWTLWSAPFAAAAGSVSPRLEIGSETTGSFWIGAVSVQPADTFHGLRRDVIAALKQIKPGALRFPGGCYAEFYQWKDGLLPVDQRPPIGPTGLWFLEPNSDDYDTQELGIDEFIALCRELGCAPAITIRLSNNTATNAAAWVEYCNGTTNTTWGAVRAARGQPQPYGVKTWFLGNELWSFGRGGMNNASNAAAATKAFAQAVQAVDPSVKLVGCLNEAGSWTSTILGQAGQFLSYGSYHRYEGTSVDLQTAAKAATVSVRLGLQSVHAAYGLPVTLDEWNTYWGQAGSVIMGMYAAGVLNLLSREAPTLGVAEAYFFQPLTEGAIMVTTSAAQLDTAGKVVAALSVHQGNRLLALPAAAADADLDTCASLRDDNRIFVTVINRSLSQSNQIVLSLTNQMLASATARLLVAHTANAAETVFDEQTNQVPVVGNRLVLTLPRCSVAVVEIPPPPKLGIQRWGDSALVLNWPDYGGWILQAQTNKAGAGFSTTWVDVPGSSAVTGVTNPISPDAGSAFYRLKSPP